MNTFRYALVSQGIASMLLLAQPLGASAEAPDKFDGSAIKSSTSKITFSRELSKENLPKESSVKDDLVSREIDRSLKGSERLIAQSTNAPLVPNPQIIIQNIPGSSTPQAPGAPTLPRAVAPPVGDISVSNIDASPEKVKFTNNPRVPRVLLRQAPAREVLMTLANYAGYNVVFSNTTATPAAGGAATPAAPTAEQTVSLEFTNESIENIFNSVLLVTGLQANVQGKTIFVGPQLPQGARNLVARTFRLNQVTADQAATFLAAQGANYNRLQVTTTDIVDPVTQRIIRQQQNPPTITAISATTAPTPGATPSSLVLKGLSVSTDPRLNALSVVGEPKLVQVAASLLTQLDARRRQVVVNVKVIDINLLNTDRFNSSFSFGFNDGFFVQDNGAAVLNFGNINPPSSATASRPGAFAQPIVPLNNVFSGTGTPTLQPFFDPQNAPFGNIRQSSTDFFDPITGELTSIPAVPYARPNFGTFNNPLQPGVSSTPGRPEIVRDADGNVIAVLPGALQYTLPGLFQYPQRFLMSLQAQIQTGNAKVLTDPSLVVQEGQSATVKLTQAVLTSVNTEVDPLSGVRTTTPVLEDAGLTLAVNVERIDDNGFVSFNVVPLIASPGAPISFDSGAGTVNTLTPLTRRELTSGLVRLRDGQSLILSGIIQETQQSNESKVPILGDIPILGALFRSRTNTNSRNEVIIILTPKIIEDNTNSTLGINYQPGQDAAEMLQRQGFPVQPRQ